VMPIVFLTAMIPPNVFVIAYYESGLDGAKLTAL
jgi:hypothetical protein